MAARKKNVAAEVKAAETKTTTKKAVESEVKAAETKTAAKRVSKKVNIELQYADKSVDVASLESKAVAAWAEATGNTKAAAKTINLYVKPEENMLYYVIEGEAGMLEL
ncbi:MAG: hypothetical protein K2H01_07185 [Ruminococcus sp.]|nr:hypothetical protein [Ruminococcus sp.]